MQKSKKRLLLLFLSRRWFLFDYNIISFFDRGFWVLLGVVFGDVMTIIYTPIVSNLDCRHLAFSFRLYSHYRAKHGRESTPGEVGIPSRGAPGSHCPRLILFSDQEKGGFLIEDC
jgi:hypothetical protein